MPLKVSLKRKKRCKICDKTWRNWERNLIGLVCIRCGWVYGESVRSYNYKLRKRKEEIRLNAV